MPTLLQSINRATTLRIGCILLAIVTLSSMLQPPVESQVAQLQDFIPDGLTADDQEKVTGLAGTISTMEWLGPLAPIAISPFFGLACLCAISQYGDGVLPLNAFVSDNPVLQNPAVLWTFVVLTIVTSLPRLTKVSKPVGQAIDQLEAWSGIITIIIIRFAGAAEPATDATAMMAVPAVLQCGFLSVSADMLFSVAAIVNILVINTVKFFFEVSVWLMPFPFVDAMLEAANKSVCAALMAVYAFSPMWATILNLVIFLACFAAFRWVKRQTAYMRTILWDPLRSMVQKSYGVPTAKQLTVFPQQEIGPFAVREQLQLIDRGDDWELLQKRLLFPSRSHILPKSTSRLEIAPGLIVNRINVASDSGSSSLLFTRRYNGDLPKLAGLLGVPMAQPSKAPSVVDLAMN